MVFPYGAVLKIQREYSFEDIYSRLDKMKEVGLNHVVIWPAVYWWEDRSFPQYPYTTGHRILEYAEKIGLKVIMETAGQITSLEYCPDFLMKDDYYTTTYEGHKEKSFLYFGYINYNHPEVKELIKKQYQEIAEHYKGYSSLYGYDIWNETMFESYDTYTLQCFREWLTEKYKHIERLNEIWDRAYYDWSQVQFNRWMWASIMPVADYRAFQKDNIGQILREWKGYIKQIDPDHPVIADNIHSMITSDGSYTRPQDDWNVAESVDEFGISFYPKQHRSTMSPSTRWNVFNAIQSASPSGKYWISELQTHNQHIFSANTSVTPEELKCWSLEGIFNGSKGIIYWMWEPFIKGLQTFGRGLVDAFGNIDTPRCKVVSDLSEILELHQEDFNHNTVANSKVAILYDRKSHDLIKAYTLNYLEHISGSIYTDSIMGIYKALWDQNIHPTFVTPKEVLSQEIQEYQMLFISNQINMSSELASVLKEYVAQGGVIICDGKIGEVSDDKLLVEYDT